MKTFEPVYIVDGARSPFLKSRNVPGPFSASDLAAITGRALLARQPFAPEDLDEVIVGCAGSAHGLPCMASRLRQRGAVLRETLPTPSFTYRRRTPAFLGGGEFCLANVKPRRHHLIGRVGCSAQRSKEGGGARRALTGDMSEAECLALPIQHHPQSLRGFHPRPPCARFRSWPAAVLPARPRSPAGSRPPRWRGRATRRDAAAARVHRR